MGSPVKHERLAAYSRFLYSSPYIGHQPRIFITPKSNVLNNNYTQAATKAMISLDNVEQLLRVMYRAFWHVENKRFIIETIRYYQNGQRYTAQTVQLDLRTIYHPRSGLSWAFDSTTFEYDNFEMPERIEYSWMENTSQYFDGYPIEVMSGYVEAGKVEQRKVDRFVADLDYMLVSSGDVDKEGFLVLDVTEDGYVPYVNMDFEGESIMLQNGYCSFIYLHPMYHVFDLPSNEVKMNDSQVTLTANVSRYKYAEHQFPLVVDPSPYRLIETEIGVGKIRKYSIDLESRHVTCTLEYDTE
jgi:hypothetical protein